MTKNKLLFDPTTRTLTLRPDEAALVVNRASFALLPSTAPASTFLQQEDPDAVIAALAFILEEPSYAEVRQLAFEQLAERIMRKQAMQN